jgi:hypothetical protein
MPDLVTDVAAAAESADNPKLTGRESRSHRLFLVVERNIIAGWERRRWRKVQTTLRVKMILRADNEMYSYPPIRLFGRIVPSNLAALTTGE